MEYQKEKNFLLFILAMIPLAFLKGQYVPILDDYIMYQGYPLYPVSYLLMTVRIWTSRPIANLLDLFLWSRFSDSLFLLSIVFLILKVLSVVFLTEFFKKQNWPRIPLVVLLLFCPVGVEATGWLSASSRIAVGLFFLSVALLFCMKRQLSLYSLFLFLSFGCYEQFWILGVLLSCKELERKYHWISFALAGFMGLYTLVCGAWSTTPRLGDGINVRIFSHILELWENILFRLIPVSFIRGLKNLNFFSVMALCGLFIAFAIVIKQENKSKNGQKWGWILFFSCYLPFLFTDQGLSFRMAYLSFIGLSLVLPPKKYLWICLAFFFCIGSVGEMLDYQRAGIADQHILEEIADGKQGDAFLYHDSSVSFGQHILSVTHSDWSLTAGLRALVKNITLEVTVP